MAVVGSVDGLVSQTTRFGTRTDDEIRTPNGEFAVWRGNGGLLAVGVYYVTLSVVHPHSTILI